MRFQYFPEDAKYHLIDVSNGKTIKLSGDDVADMKTIDKAFDIAFGQFGEAKWDFVWNNTPDQNYVTVIFS